jgi:hypothetical protein
MNQVVNNEDSNLQINHHNLMLNRIDVPNFETLFYIIAKKKAD